MGFTLEQFNEKKKYKYIGSGALATPAGVITKKHPYSYSGKQWKGILVYDFGNSPSFSKMFREVKPKKKGKKK